MKGLIYYFIKPVRHSIFIKKMEHWPLILLWKGFFILGFFPGFGLADSNKQSIISKPQEVEFNPAFTNNEGSGAPIDLSSFNNGNKIPSGTYNVDLFVNDGLVMRTSINFLSVEGHQSAQPCFQYETIVLMGVDVNKLDPLKVAPNTACIRIQDINDEASARMDIGQLRLDVSIPQEFMSRQARGYVNPQLWDQGEPALLLGYNINVYSVNQKYSGISSSQGVATGLDGATVSVVDKTYYRQNSDGSFVPSKDGNYMLSMDGRYIAVRPGSFISTRQKNGYDNVNAYLGLNSGFNIAGWRLRNQGNVAWDRQNARAEWTNIGTTASHDITALKAQIMLGQTYTQGMVFDSTPFRGVTIFSDERMQPDSMQGYAPVVRGVAKTRARVELRQNGSLIYETTVPPGPFTINDLYSSGYAGDIVATVFEADGEIHTFTVPFSSIPMLLRPGMDRWAFTGGQVYLQNVQEENLNFIETTYQRGINNWLTLYGGFQAANGADYKNVLAGMAVNTFIGAFGTDISRSETALEDGKLSGQSYRLSYSKTIPSSETTFTLATYRYSNSGYLSLSDAVLARTESRQRQWVGDGWRNKQRVQLTLSQNLGSEFGSLYFNGLRNTYWGDSGSTSTYQLGYSNTWRNVTYGITAGRTFTSNYASGGSRYENQLGLNIMIPLGGASSSSQTLTLSTQHDSNSGNSHRASINGVLGETNQYNYNASVNYQNLSGDKTSFSAGSGWMAPYANMNGGISYSEHYNQGSASIAGGVVAHQGGITLAPQIDVNSPVGIAYAPNAKGAHITSGARTEVDRWGYAVVTGLTPYRMNDVTLDPAGTSLEVELETTRLQTAPRAGAVIPLTFATKSGRALLIRATRPGKEPLPLGADVIDSKGQVMGMVGQGGQIFIRTDNPSGELLVKWGKEHSQHCHIAYNVPAAKTTKPMTTLYNVCK